MTPRENIERLLKLVEQEGWEQHGEELVHELLNHQFIAREYHLIIEQLAMESLNTSLLQRSRSD